VLLRTFRALFPRRERWLLAGVLAVAIVAAFFETVGVASILPFMALVLDPSALERYPALSAIARWLGTSSSREAVVVLGTATAVLVALGNGAAALNVFVNERFAARTAVRLATRLLAGYLAQPYAFHVARDAPSLMKMVLIDVRTSVVAVLRPFLLAVSRGLMAAGLLSLLFVQDPWVALVLAVVLGTAYSVVFRVVRVRQRRLGAEAAHQNLERQRIAQEALGGVKDLQMLGRQRHAVDRFTAATAAAATAEASNQVTAALPRYVLETIAVGGILLVTLVLLSTSQSGAAAIVPVLALYAFACYRLLPALQQIFAAAVSIRFYQPVMKSLVDDYTAVVPMSGVPVESDTGELQFAEAIRLEQVSFTYAGSAASSLNAIDLTIRPRESIGLVGRTGAGKTTLADLLLGLYEPTLGSITVDGVPLVGPAVRAWRRRVGYVPQHVFLANASVAENIAFALPASEIDHAAVERAARLAQAHEFIGSLPRGYDTVVGERGVKLSGGQRQRIGVARAVYHNPDVLVFDEATSALDGMTEDALMDEIRALSGERTVILIAHRLRTVEACDRIIMLDDGRIRADGRYEELLQTSEDFRRLVGRAQATTLKMFA
jgi:ABC-type multidrug transport system fused ATPase/permease subunit